MGRNGLNGTALFVDREVRVDLEKIMFNWKICINFVHFYKIHNLHNIILIQVVLVSPPANPRSLTASGVIIPYFSSESDFRVTL